MNKERILIFVGAHPDDETLGIGATLAQYASSGVKVYYICATRGEAGETDAESMSGFSSVSEMRTHELDCATRELGLAEVIHLDYRDSGMSGSEDNKHPNAFINASEDIVVKRIVEIFRKIKPQVVLTFDPIGGYRHPDHIHTHNVTVKAFHAAGDTEQYPECGPTFQPQKLYFHTRNHGLMKLAIKLMPLFGQNPRKFGRNKDIDMTKMIEVEYPVHAVIKLKKESLKRRSRAAACHRSQTTGGPRPGGILFLFARRNQNRDNFSRIYPPFKGGKKEKDLFQGID